MSVRERILAIRIAEAISKHPEIAEELGISAELVLRAAVCTEIGSKKTVSAMNGGKYLCRKCMRIFLTDPMLHL